MGTKDNMAHNHADAFHAQCRYIVKFIEINILPIARRSQLNDKQWYMTIFARMIGIMRSIVKLNCSLDFQAHAASARALYEIAIDLTFRVYDPVTYTHAKLIAWDKSAKLHAAERIGNYYTKTGKAAPAEARPQIDFIKKEKANVELERYKLWSQRKHPPRWTGRNLRDDSEEADKVATFNFEEFYVVRYSQLCWNTHGSGLVGIYGIDESNFPGISALIFNDIIRFSILIGELSMKVLEVYDGISCTLFKRLHDDLIILHSIVSGILVT